MQEKKTQSLNSPKHAYELVEDLVKRRVARNRQAIEEAKKVLEGKKKAKFR